MLGPDITEPFLRAGSYGLAVHTPRGRVISAPTHCTFRPSRIPSPPALALCSNYNFLFLSSASPGTEGVVGGPEEGAAEEEQEEEEPEEEEEEEEEEEQSTQEARSSTDGRVAARGEQS